MKKLFTLLSLIALPALLFGQIWNGGLGNTLQRSFINGHWQYRFNLGNSNLGYYYPPEQTFIDSALQVRPVLPTGQLGQQLKVSLDNTNTYLPVEPLVYGQFVYTAGQLSRAMSAGAATQLQIFNSFKRFSHGGSPTDPQGQDQNNTIPGQPSQTNSWSYDTVSNRFNSTFNTGSNNGLVSSDRFESYVHTATIGATATNDNDRIGIIIAFAEDPSDLVPNNAYGLNPSDFTWPIDVTSVTIPNQHSLGVYFNRDNNSSSYFVAYDYRKLTQQILYNGSSLPGLYNTTNVWLNQSLDVKIVRTKDTITITRSQYSDAPGGKGSLGFQIKFTLNDNPVLAKFKGAQSYGYTAQSQDHAYFSNLYFSGSNNILYDLRNGNTYPFTGSGYTLDSTKNMYRDLGTRFFWRNRTEHTFGYILPTNTYDVIVGETP